MVATNPDQQLKKKPTSKMALVGDAFKTAFTSSATLKAVLGTSAIHGATYLTHIFTGTKCPEVMRENRLLYALATTTIQLYYEYSLFEEVNDKLYKELSKTYLKDAPNQENVKESDDIKAIDIETVANITSFASIAGTQLICNLVEAICWKFGS